MPIRFRCVHCAQLLSIGRRKAGAAVNCPTCGKTVVVPLSSDAARSRSLRFGDQPPMAEAWGRSRPAAEGATGDVQRRVRFRRVGVLEEELDLTPMVDVAFLLMIFFMLTASYSIQKSFAMPRQDMEQLGARQAIRTLTELQKDHVLVRIGVDNSIWVDDAKTPPAELAAKIRSSIRSTGRTELLIAADDRAWHETVVQVMDVASAIGVERVRLATPTRATQQSKSQGDKGSNPLTTGTGSPYEAELGNQPSKKGELGTAEISRLTVNPV